MILFILIFIEYLLFSIYLLLVGFGYLGSIIFNKEVDVFALNYCNVIYFIHFVIICGCNPRHFNFFFYFHFSIKWSGSHILSIIAQSLLNNRHFL